MNRRDALRLIAAVPAVSVAGHLARGAEDAIARSQLGIVIYALNLRRKQLQRADAPGDLFEPHVFLDYCHRLGAGGVQVPIGVRDKAYTSALRSAAEQKGMFIEGIVNPPKSESDAERFEAEIRAAKDAGANVLRTVVLPGRRYEQFDSLEAFREAVARGRQSLLLAAPVVERHKVRLAVENHKDQRVDERLTLLKEISSEYVGACVDVGNSFSLLEDPLEAVKAYAPWAMTVHLKDQAVQSYDDGFLFADVPLGGGFLDLKQMVAELRRAKPDVRFSLETITRDPLRVPCLTEKYWATMPKVPGADLARTMRTVGVARATQLEAIESLRLEEQAAIEAAGIEQSLGYAKKELQL